MERFPASHENFDPTPAEALADAYVNLAPTSERPADPGLDLCGTHLSFSELPNVDFKPQMPDESDAEFAERVQGLEQRKFIGYFLAQEKGGPEAVAEAFTKGDFRLRRSQRREFLNAIAHMPAEEYEARVNDLLQLMPKRRTPIQTTINQANSIWLKGRAIAIKERELDAEAVSTPQVNSYPDNPAPRRMPYYENEFRESTPEVAPRRAPSVVYREAKQARRSKSFWQKFKDGWNDFIHSSVDLEHAGESRRERERRLAHEAELRNLAKRSVARRPAFYEEYAPGTFGATRPENGYFQRTRES